MEANLARLNPFRPTLQKAWGGGYRMSTDTISFARVRLHLSEDKYMEKVERDYDATR